MKKSSLRNSIAGMALATAGAVAVPGIASASTASFQQAQQKLEQQLTFRVSQLSRLSADVTGSKTLTTAHANVLNARLATESSDINALVTKVPSDTTFAQLNADRQAMINDNRVFAVETPQVIQIIAADADSANLATYVASEPSLQAAVNALEGQPSYDNALRHYNAFVSEVQTATSDIANVVTNVIAQVPGDYPGDIPVFRTANQELLNAAVSLARASFNETIVGLASGGYTGS